MTRQEHYIKNRINKGRIITELLNGVGLLWNRQITRKNKL